MIYVTHDQVEAMALAGAIVVLRAGRVEQVGSPLDLRNRPVNQFAAGFIGSPKMNFLRASPAPQSGHEARIVLGGTLLSLPHLHPADAPELTFGIRPERLSVSDAGPLLGEARVQLVEQLGGTSFIYGVLADGQPVSMQLEGQQRLSPGDSILLRLDPRRGRLFMPDGASCRRHEAVPVAA